jgi:large subunit ribosomal protein L10
VERQQKEASVASLRSALEASNLVVVTRQTGITVAESTDLRCQMRSANAHFKVAKNTLVRLAIADLPCAPLASHLKGPVALAYSHDPVAAAKVVCEYANTNKKIEVVCGYMGNKFLSKAEVEALAKLPSLDELRGTIIGIIQAPASKLVRTIQAPAGQLARVFGAYAKS